MEDKIPKEVSKGVAGINIAGFISKQFGLGEGARSNIRSVKAAGIPFVVNDSNIQLSKYVMSSGVIPENLSEDNPFPVNLVQVNIDRLFEYVSHTSVDYFKGKYNIAFWAWELETFPEESKAFFNLFDEIWVPSNFCAEAVSKVSPVPVLKVMHSIKIDEKSGSRSDFGIPEDSFVFLTLFDYYSSIDRKNPIGVIDAYESAFGINDPKTTLVIKSSISLDFPEAKSQLLARIGQNKSIILIEEILDTPVLYGLMDMCDCLVSLHRSEGFGLTMAEAMYLGKPVIATGYSANMEFMNINNSFPVRYKMVSTGSKYYYSSDKDMWADPDITHASELMGNVFKDRKTAAQIAQRGMEDVKFILNPERLGAQIRQRLELISTFDLGSGRDTSAEAHFLKFENEILQQKIDKLKSYMPIRMKLAFKNFKNKLTGSNRKYMWEN